MDRVIALPIPAGGTTLEGLLAVPAGAPGLVLFVHGSGSSRLSPRNTYVARALRESGIGTLLFDLLGAGEGEDRELVFDVDLLARRLRDVTAWARTRREAKDLPLAYFGASTGAAAALIAAAEDSSIAAVVSRGGRPDLAADALPRVQAPTLLIVGGDDVPVLRMNREAARRMRCEHRLAVVPGASHLFEEAGTLEQVVVLATQWFRAHLPPKRDERCRSSPS